MTVIGIDMTTNCCHTVAPDSVPDLHGVIITPRSDTLPIGRPGHRKNIISMPMIGKEKATQGDRGRGRFENRRGRSGSTRSDEFCNASPPDGKHSYILQDSTARKSSISEKHSLVVS